MNRRLQFCHNRKIDGKRRSLPQFAVDLYAAPVGLYDRLRQRQAETHALGVLGKAAAVKTLENMVQILWMDAAAAVLYGNLCQAGRLLPLDADAVTWGRVVQSF